MNEEENLESNARADLQRKESPDQRQLDSIISSQAGHLGETDEHLTLGSDRAVGQDERPESRASRLKGVLRQIKQLQSEHLAYVNAHGQRLEQRLLENREHKEKILGEIADLEQELNQLLAEAESQTE